MPFVSLNERVDRLNQNSPRLGENRSTREKTKEEAEKTGVARCHGGRRKREGEREEGGRESEGTASGLPNAIWFPPRLRASWNMHDMLMRLVPNYTVPREPPPTPLTCAIVSSYAHVRLAQHSRHSFRCTRSGEFPSPKRPRLRRWTWVRNSN